MKTLRSKRNLLVMALAVMIAVSITGCGGGNSTYAGGGAFYGPDPGDGIIATLQENGEDVYRLTGVYYQFDDDGRLSEYRGGNDYVMLMTNEEFLSENFERQQKLLGRSDTAPISASSVEYIVQNDWDEYVNGMEDEGANTHEFVELVNAYGSGNLGELISLYNESGQTMEEFVKCLTAIKELNNADSNEIIHFKTFLEQIGMNLNQFYSALQNLGSDPADFFAHAKIQGLDFYSLIDLYMQGSWESAEAFLSAVLSGNASQLIAARGDDPVALSVAKFAWDIIKDGRPQSITNGAFTTVLSSKDTDPIDYAYAKESKTSTYDWNIKNLFTMNVITCQFCGSAFYQAKNQNFYGDYMPNVSVDTPSTWVAWGFNLNASASVSNVVNVGGFYSDQNNPPNPQIDIIGKYIFSSWLTSTSSNIRFRANGRSGIQYLGGE